MTPTDGVRALLQAAAQPQHTFELQVVQQPVRARMCGLGDRDRRPISPPCVLKLICTSIETGLAIPVEDIDTSFLVIAADLRTADYRDANLVQPSPAMGSRHPSADLSDDENWEGYSRSPSPGPSHQSTEQQFSPSSSDAASVLRGDKMPTPPNTIQLESAEFGSTTSTSPRTDSIYSPALSSVSLEPVTSTSAAPFDPRRHPSAPPFNSPPLPVETGTEPTSFIPYVRRPTPVERTLERIRPRPAAVAEVPNLIGALHSNAFKLRDEEGRLGVFFVLPDLSVRTEGDFRLRCRLMSIGSPSGLRTDSPSPIVATVNTEVFRSSSAKNFPGMVDPTELSKCLAKQGIRIPVRRATKQKARTAV